MKYNRQSNNFAKRNNGRYQLCHNSLPRLTNQLISALDMRANKPITFRSNQTTNVLDFYLYPL